jgi:1,4-dihydroxy-2-naphthoate octaprenyltransferase
MRRNFGGDGLYRFWKGFWLVADPKIWIASTIPMLVGTAFAYGSTGNFNLYWFIVSLIGLYFIEIGKNAANDLVDYKTGVDLAVAEDKRTPFSGGRHRALINGKISLDEASMIAAVTLLIGAAFGIYISQRHEPMIFWIGAAGLFFALAYSVPPFKLAYRGLGEIVVGITFGPLIVSGAFVLQAHYLAVDVLLVSLPIGFLIANILFINQYPDYEADKQCSKRNWVVRLGKERGLRVYVLLFVMAYLSIILLFVWTKNPFWLLSLMSLPLVIQATRVAARTYNDIPEFVLVNITTLQTYQFTGATMVVSAILRRFI